MKNVVLYGCKFLCVVILFIVVFIVNLCILNYIFLFLGVLEL